MQLSCSETMLPYPKSRARVNEWTPDYLFIIDAERLIERDSYGDSLLHVAARTGNCEAVEHLLNLSADPNDRNFSGETPLILAAARNHSEVVHRLLSADCDVNSRDNSGNCALSASAYHRQLEMVELLLENGADVTVTDSLGNSCLHAALLAKSREGDDAVVRVLLEAGGSSVVNSMTFEGNTPLHLLASGCGFDCHTDRLETKRMSGIWRMVGLDETNNEDSLSFQCNVLPNLNIFGALLDRGADLLRRNARGETPLIRAAAAGCCHVVEKLLGRMKQDHVDLADNYGQTALIRAAQNHHPYVVKQLLVAGASVNCRDYRGYTALHAVVCGPFECLSTPVWNVHCLSLSNEELRWRDRKEIVVRVLLHLGHAQVGATDWRGETAFDLLCKAPELYSSAVIDMLAPGSELREERLGKRGSVADNGVRSCVRVDKRGRTVLHCLPAEWETIDFLMGAIFDEFENNASVVEQAIKKATEFHLEWTSSGRAMEEICSSTSIRDDKGRVPLHHLAMKSRMMLGKAANLIDNDNLATYYEQMIRTMLADDSSCANVTDIYGRTPLHYATSEQLRELLVRYGAREDVRDMDGFTAEDMRRQHAAMKILDRSKLKVIQSIYHTEIALYSAEILEHIKRYPKRCNLLKVLRPDFDTTTTAWRIWTELDYAYRREDSQNYNEVDAFIRRLLAAMRTIDPLLESRHVLVGSTREGTAINLQHEFDIDVMLTGIGKLCEVVESPVAPKGYVLLHRKWEAGGEGREVEHGEEAILGGEGGEGEGERQVRGDGETALGARGGEGQEAGEEEGGRGGEEGRGGERGEKERESGSGVGGEGEGEGEISIPPGKNAEFLFNEEGYLLTENLNLRFQHVLVEVLKDGEFWRDEPVFELDLMEEVKLMAFRFTTPLCKTLPLTRVRPTTSRSTTCLRISIDIVPCINVERWWPEDALTDVSFDLRSDGCQLVLDQPQRRFPWVPYADPYARISFALAESAFIARSSSTAKAAFMVCKQMLQGQKGSTYPLKMSLLYCIEALGKATPHRASFEEVTSPELTLWVRKLLQCYLHFCLLDFVPCYFMPAFLQPFEGRFRSSHIDLYLDQRFRERRRIAGDIENEDSLMRAFRLYWSVCDAVTDVDFQIPVPQPLFEKFNRKEFIGHLYRLTND